MTEDFRLKTNYHICIVIHGDLRRSSRVLSEARSLAAEGWRVLVVDILLGDDSETAAFESMDGFTVAWVTSPLLRGRSDLKTLGKLIQLVTALPLVIARIRQSRARVFHGVAFTGLLILALAGIRRRPVVYDTLELFFDRPFDQMPSWIVSVLNRLRPVEAGLIRRTAAVVAVSDGQADVLATRHAIPRPAVIRNTVDLRRLGPAAADFPAWEGRTVVHSGNLVEGRHLPDLVAALPLLPEDVRLALLGSGTLEAELVTQAQHLGVADRLVIVAPVPIDSVAQTVAQADVAAVLTSSPHLNNQNALPNKFFEAVAAGLPMVSSSIPEVKRLVEQFEIGLACDPDDPADIAAKLLAVLEPETLATFQANAQRAREQLNWQQEEQRLIVLYRDLLEQHGH